MSSKSSLKVDWCSDAAAKFACKNWHYSKSLPAGKLAKLGAWEDGSFIGCIVFGWGANKNMAQVYGLKQTECAELVRIALTDHKNTVSRIMAVSIKFLKRQSPGVRLLVSYADPAQGHHGGGIPGYKLDVFRKYGQNLEIPVSREAASSATGEQDRILSAVW
jgi:hypothetical protein